MNILTIGILAIFLFFAATGWRKGLIRKLAGIVSLLAASLLVSVTLPYITEFIKTETPVYQYIADQCEAVLTDQVLASILPEEQTEDGTALDREQIKSLLEQYGVDSSMVDYLSDEELQNLASQYLQEYMNQSSQEGSTGSALSLTKIEQTKLIQSLPVPNFLKELMLNYNNSEGYSRLEVTDFAGYLVHFFANIILNILAFVVTLVVAQIVLWTGITTLDLFSRLPIISLINRIGGLAVGVLQGLLITWMIFLVISIGSATEWGISLMNMINASSILKPLYESNLFLKIIVQAISNVM